MDGRDRAELSRPRRISQPATSWPISAAGRGRGRLVHGLVRNRLHNAARSQYRPLPCVAHEVPRFMLTVSAALKKRISVRKFLPTPVPESAAPRTPGRRALVTVRRQSAALESDRAGRHRTGRSAAELAGQRHVAAGKISEEGSDPVYPPHLWEPYRTRRYQVGEDMYLLLGVNREDRAGRLAHVARNFEFFGAPVGLFFVIDRRLGRAQWAHLGMFMQSLALVAVERGLGTLHAGILGAAARFAAPALRAPGHRHGLLRHGARPS